MLQLFRKWRLRPPSASRTGFVSPTIARAAGITVIAFTFFAFAPAHAGISELLGSGSSWLFSQASSFLYLIVYFLGKITAVLFDILVKVSQYNGFLDAPAVTVGWRVVRDLSNMFFIAVLLMIAFGTLFRIQRYYYATLLRQLVIMAVLINFSKVITGFFIDMMQVIMLTFVNAYAETAAGNLTTALGLNKILELMGSTNAATGVSPYSFFATLLLAVILFGITAAIVLVFAIIFLIRIVALWILTVLSPLAYLFAAFPQTNGYASKWWGEFWKYATVGPVLAFFLWLTLTITAAGNTYTLVFAQQNALSNVSIVDNTASSGANDPLSVALSSVSTSTGILGFMVSTILLVFSLSFASGISGGGGALASKLSGNIQRRGASIAKGVGRIPGRALGGLYSATIKEKAEEAMQKIAGAAGSTKVPFLADAGRSVYNRISERSKKVAEGAGKDVGGLNDAMLGSIINSAQFTPTGRARRKAALKAAPYLMSDDKEFIGSIQSMELDDFKKISAERLINIQKRLQKSGKSIHDIDSDKGRWLVSSAPAQKKNAAGYSGWQLDKDTSEVVKKKKETALDKNGNPIPDKNGNPRTRMVTVSGAVPIPDESAVSNYKAYTPSPSINTSLFNATEAAIGAAGSADAFFQSATYASNPTRFLSRDEYMAATARTRARSATSGNANDIAGIATATRRGQRGEVASVSINPNDPAFAKIRPLITGEGSYITGDQKPEVVQLLTAKYRNQLLDQEANRRVEEQRLEGARSGKILSPSEQQGLSQTIRQQVADDALFNQSVASKADQFRAGLEDASAIALIDKNGLGSVRQTIRHERAHGVTDMLSDSDKQEIWNALPPNRQAEVKAYVGSHWANGAQMSDEQIAEEFITEHLANRGKNAANAMRLNPEEREKYETTRHMIADQYKGNATAFYGSAEYNNGKQLFLNEDQYNAAHQEEGIANRLEEMISGSRYEKSRRDVEAIPSDVLHSFFGQLAGARQREVLGYLEVPEVDENRMRATEKMISQTFGGDASKFYKSQYYNTDKGSYIDPKEYNSYTKSRGDAERQFFIEALAAHNGEGQKGPLGFAKGENDLAFLIHAASQNKRPSSAVSSVAEASSAPAAPRVVARPSGERRITAEPPQRIVERVIETPPSPTLQANITNNNTIRALGDDMMQKLGGKVQDLPSRNDLLAFLNRIQTEIQGVGRQQSLQGSNFQGEIASLNSQLEHLKQDAQSPDTSEEGQLAMQSNLKKFMKQLRSQLPKQGFDTEETTQNAA